jgi:hypothetical protein
VSMVPVVAASFLVAVRSFEVTDSTPLREANP